MSRYKAWRSRWGLLLPALALACVGSNPSTAEEVSSGCTPSVARIVSVQGTVEIRRAGAGAWAAVKRLDTPVCQGDLIHTGLKSRAGMVILPEKFVRLDQNSTLRVSVTGSGATEETQVEFFTDERVPKEVLGTSCGAGYFVTRFPRKFKVRTQFINAAVEGTEFLVTMSCSTAAVAVYEGKVSVEPVLASVAPLMLKTGETVSAGPGEAPVVKLLVKPVDAVQWALYYPPLTGPGSGEPQDAECNQVAADEKSRCLTGRAEQRLRVGRVDDAQSDIEASLALVPDNSDADALLSIISVVKNDKQEAVAFAQRATQHDAMSPRAWIALSYAQQASFKLEDALTSAERAAGLSPRSSTAQARVAELLMSLGRIKSAERAARAAVEADPTESRAHTILGFVHLAQIDTNRARADFDAAIERDSSDPLPRLGLGLAIIRDGDLKSGREQIEIAVSLDPTNSLIRSYVGKAYYEENTKERDQLAGIQFGLAAQLDPQDPTPWFYDAIRKETENRPGEAFADLSQSIERNDNRAVYRSRLLLDQDLSARGASLARIYEELGFDQLALNESFKSLSSDPGNFSAHRFLVDAYRDTPRYEIARTSELLQSQLFQPLSVAPVPPQLGETDFSSLAGAGPGFSSFNEFNPLFVRNGLHVQASGAAGSDSTLGDELTVSGLVGKTSFSLGQYHYETDGFRPNADYKRDIYNAFIQYAATPWLSLQLEVRSSSIDNGDITQRIDPDNFSTNFRQSVDLDTYRVGLRYAFSAQSQVLISLAQQRRNELQTDSSVTDFGGGITLTDTTSFNTVTDTTTAEVRWAWSAPRFTLDVGAGYDAQTLDEKQTVSSAFTFPPFPPVVSPPTFSETEANVPHSNVYAYSSYEILSNLRATLGLAYEESRQSRPDFSREQLDPKAGIVWSVTPATTLRAGAFRVLKRSLGANETIEPTTVAGFNQFFDDPNATDARNYGLGLDQRFSSTVFAGVEGTRRLLDVPVQITTPTNAFFQTERQTETHGRGYAYWLPIPSLSLKAEYFYEQLSREVAAGTFDPTNPNQVTTHRVPIGLRYHHPSGLFAELQQTYVYQAVQFPNGAPTVQQFTSHFWLTDVALGYRLPQRRGIISFEIKNLFDSKFGYQDTDLSSDPRLPLFWPKQLFMLKVNVAL